MNDRTQEAEKLARSVAQAEHEPPKLPEVKETTLGELGPNLPIGTLGVDGALHKAMQCRPWRMKEEKELSKLRNNNDIADYISTVVAYMYTRLGHHDFTDVPLAERKVAVSQMFHPDVWYAYSWLRVQAIGYELPFNITCPKCRVPFKHIADLRTLRVRAVEDPSALAWEHKLKTPMTIRKRKVEGFRMFQSRWTMIENVQGGSEGQVIANAKSGLITGTVVGFLGEDEDVQLTEDDLDEMTKYDIESTSEAINDRTLGPRVAIEFTADDPFCTNPRCMHKMEYRCPIDWGYDGFFGVSSS